MGNGEWKIDVIVNYQPPYSKVCANGLENGGLRAARRMTHLHIVYPPGRAMLAQATLNHTSLGCTLCVPTI